MNNKLSSSIKRTLCLFLSIFAFAGCKHTTGYQNTDTISNIGTRLDTLIVNGLVYTGDNIAPTQKVIGLKGKRIAYIGTDYPKNMTFKRTIDARGYWVMPGFIDPHTHSLSDLKSKDKRFNLNYLTQGVTTVFVGNDGEGTPSVNDLLNTFETNGIGTNVGVFVGHGAVRKMVMGRENRQPSKSELKDMKTLIDQAMSQGAFGLSTGLFYVPGIYAETTEVIELSKVAAKHGGIYESHIRDESSYTIGLNASIAEVLEVAEKANIPVHIGHIKALGVDVWGQSKDVINMVEKAQRNGLKVTADQYPWQASSTKLQNTTIPRWALEGEESQIQSRLNDATLLPRIKQAIKENIRRRGGPDSLLIVTTPHSELVGKTIKDLSNQWQINPVETVLRVLRKGVVENSTRVASFNMNQDDIHAFMVQPWVMTSSDGTDGHPRKYASYPEKYTTYVLGQKLMPVHTFVYKCSGLVADTLNIKKRGYLREGYYADISIIAPDSYAPKANFEKWNQLAEGVVYQWVNGALSIENSKYVNSLSGEAIRLNEE